MDISHSVELSDLLFRAQSDKAMTRSPDGEGKNVLSLFALYQIQQIRIRLFQVSLIEGIGKFLPHYE